jgi:hypothetical protein
MAADKSPPRIRVIATTALGAILVLVGLKFVFDSYYVAMFEAEEQRKVAAVPPADLLALRAAEQRSFARARIPLRRAMDIVARGRVEPIPGLEDGGVAPVPSDDTGPLIGWAGLAASRGAPAGAAAPSASAAPTVLPATPPSGSAAPSPSVAPRGSATPAPP